MAASDMTSCMMVAGATAWIVWQKLDMLLPDPVCVECFRMQASAEDAKAKLATIQDFISTQYGPSKTTEWLGRLLQALYYAEEFIDKFHLREARERHEALRMAARPLAALVSKCKLWRDLSMLVKKMDELCDEKFLKEEAEGKRIKEPAISSSASVPWQGKKLARLTSFWDGQVPTNFLCRQDEKNEIMSRIKIKSGWTAWTSIWGEQGTGKTFLARWVYSQVKYMGYEWRNWVHVSGCLDEREFLFNILKQAGKVARGMKDMEIKEIMIMLRQELTEKKKFLIVLDDVRPSDKQLLRVLAISIPLFSDGHIITTTQDGKIARWTDTPKANPISLKNLSNEESRKMLAWKLHGVPEAHRLSKEEKDILDKFRGLPLHISLLGGFLSNAGERERTALAEQGFKFDILQLSCHRLPVHLKPCFICMALFPVEFPIPTRRLVRLWLAKGLLDSCCYGRERERIRQPEDVGETFILELADRNVIDVVSWRADGSPKSCQMVTSLYDMIRPIAMRMGFFHIHETSKLKDRNDRDPTSQQQQPLAQLQKRTQIRWLAELTNVATDDRGSSYSDLNLGHVRSFLSFNLRRGVLTKDISTLLRKMTSENNYSLLRVLDLEGVYKPSLKGVLHKLVLLRYLGLRSTVLDSLPSAISDLHYLETLDIKHTNITSLPSSFWKARNLRHLHLNWFYIDLKNILKACSNNVNALTQLQTLSGLVIGEVKETSGLENSLTTLTTLKLFLQHSDNDTSGAAGKTIAHWISFRLTNLQSLTFGVIQEPKPVEVAMKVDQPAQEAEPAEEAEPTEEVAEEAEPAKEAEPAEEVEPAKEATKVSEPEKEAEPVPEVVEPAKEVVKPTKEVEPTKEATKVSEPEKEDKKEGKKEAKPVTSQIGTIPELSLAEKHHELLELYLLGQLHKPIWTQLLPISLRVLTLSGSKVEIDMMPQLGGLLKQLRTFRLLANSFLGTSLRFAKDGFPSLMILKIWKLPRLKKVIIERGAMLHLKELEFRHLDANTKVRGIKECKELENICVVFKKGARNFVDCLDKQKKKTQNLCMIEETETNELTDDDKSP